MEKLIQINGDIRATGVPAAPKQIDSGSTKCWPFSGGRFFEWIGGGIFPAGKRRCRFYRF